MNELIEISNKDCVISKLLFDEDGYNLFVTTWDGSVKQIHFENSYHIIEQMSVGEEIGDIFIKDVTYPGVGCEIQLFENDIINLDSQLKHLYIYDSWNEAVLLEAILENIVLK